jgi:hypothetical protein
MMDANLIPALDAAGIPGPEWLFHLLLVFTFFLHLVFVNLTLGGTILAFIAHLRAGGRADDPNGVLAGRMMGVNAYGISLAITTGVAPLLFIQLIYQQYFYSGTILLGWLWFGFLILLMAGYYAAYLFKFRGAPSRGTGGGVWLGVSAACFLLIAMTHVAVHLIHTQPAKWPQFAVNPLAVLGDATYWPRLLHFVLAGIGFAALVIAWWAARRAAAGEEVELNTAIAKSGWRWALWTTAAQVMDGVILLVVLPRDVIMGIMSGGVATLIPLTLSILLAVGLLMMLARSMNPVEHRGLITGALAAMVLTIAVMSITRHQVRILYLDPVASQYQLQAVPQWGNFALFVVLLVIGLATVAYMVKRVLTEPATGDEAA